jgi:NFU1 iron-sulfur cluster scaffold homolog, mitochondrial
VTAELVPLHPEPVDGTDRELRWVVPAGTFTFVGAVARLPDSIRVLVGDGTLESVTVEPMAVRTRLAVDRSWRDEGARVRAALHCAVAAPQQWIPAENGCADDVLRRTVQEVIDGEVGAYVRSHGGDVQLIVVRDGNVEVQLTGACRHCPASDLTLTDRFEKAVRARYPAVRSVTSRGAEVPSGARRWLGLPRLLHRPDR